MLRFFAFLGRKREFVILGVAVGLSGWMLSLKEHDKLKLAFSVSTSLLQLGQKGFSWSIHLMDLRQENKRLEHIATELSLENSFLKEAKEENERLRNLLGFEEKSGFDLLPAEVIGWGPDRTVRSILINIGQSKGVKPNMPVVMPEGLVGKVYRVMPYVSVVQLLLDPNCRVGGIVQRSRVLGIVEWERGNQCFLRSVPVRSDVREGDIVVTSGMGGIFPKGLRIGSVSRVRGEGWELFKEVIIDPVVNFTHVEEVFVLINEDPTQPAVSDRSTAPSIHTR